MIKKIIENNKTLNIFDENVKKIKSIFPDCVDKEGNVDASNLLEKFDKEKIRDEGYGLNFLGKNYASNIAILDSETVIKPDSEHNTKEENKDSKNIYISGDNIDALKHLLKSYSNNIKCIYIDPPYNTGSDGFIYNDNFNFTPDSLSQKLSITIEEAKRILDLTKRGSASHSAWLMFMYPRLLLARDLLADDGIIFISIDDNEQANLKLLCDSIFGEDNSIATIAVEMSKTQGMKVQAAQNGQIVKNHEYVLAYCNKSVYMTTNRQVLYDEAEPWDSHFDTLIDDELNMYNLFDFFSSDKDFKKLFEKYSLKINKAGLFKLLILDEKFKSCFYNKLAKQLYRKSMIASDEIQALEIESNKIVKYKDYLLLKNNAGTIEQLQCFYDTLHVSDEYEPQFERCTIRGALWKGFYSDMMNIAKEGEIEYKNGKKPVRLMKQLIKWANFKDGYILDFFSGSGSTAHAVMQYNIENDAHLNFIAVQLQENLDEKYNNSSGEIKKQCKEILDLLDSIHKPHFIDELGIERIKRVGLKIKAESPDYNGDLGFKHYILKEVPQNTIDRLEKFNPVDQGIQLSDDILSLFGEQTVLTTWLIRDGYTFNNSCKKIVLNGYNAYWCDNHLYLIDENISEEAIKALVEKYEDDGSFNPANIVVFGYSFTWISLENLKNNLNKLQYSEKGLRVNFDIRY